MKAVVSLLISVILWHKEAEATSPQFYTLVQNTIENFEKVYQDSNNGSVDDPLAVIVLIPRDLMQNWSLTYFQTGGEKLLENFNYNNFRIASPNSSRNGSIEVQLLQPSQISILLGKFQDSNNGNNPAAAIIYSRTACVTDQCLQNYINAFAKLSVTDFKGVFYEAIEGNVNIKEIRNHFHANGITLKKYTHWESCKEKLISEKEDCGTSFMENIDSCLESTIDEKCFFNKHDGIYKYFVKQLMNECDTDFNDTGRFLQCAQRLIIKTTSDDCIYSNKKALIKRVHTCIKKGMNDTELHYIFKYLKAKRIESHTVQRRDHHDYHPAGPGWCKTRCAYHGYPYKWCYLRGCEGCWDYCCAKPCGFHGYSYRWCWTNSWESRWDYC